MKKTIRSKAVIAVLAMAVSSASSVCFAQSSGEATYKAKCQMCHGTDGLGTTPAGKAMKAVPFTDPQILNKPDADLIAATKNGKGKMPAYAGKLSDGDIKAVIAYIHTLQKK
jgi:mono/diheme cytochrome c family protein